MPAAVPAGTGGADRFLALWRRCLLPGATDHGAEVHDRLLQGYNESTRHYHDFSHIEHCLSMFERCKSLVEHPDALELAVWFHDVILEAGKKDNEFRSAKLYLKLSEDAHPDDTRELVERLILATLHDGSPLPDGDAAYMVDIDLSSFGMPWEQFLRDSENLRLENPQLCDAEHQQRQQGFRDCLVARERFFQTDFFAERYETRARENLARYYDEFAEGS